MSTGIRLLVVCDGQLRFGADSSLSLDLCLHTLDQVAREALPPDFQVRWTTAYRRGKYPLAASVHGAELALDRITPEILDGFDVVWLFGHESGPAHLDSGEQDAFTCFLAAGGSVFATGDHGAMGRALCGGLPFIGSMRSWEGKDEQGRSVDEQRTHTVDTRSPVDPRIIEENVPDTAFPSKLIYPTFVRMRGRRMPHPIVSLPGHRVLRTLPRHRHEGVCFSGELAVKASCGTVQGEACVIARAMTLPGQDGNRLIYEPRCINVISALDSPTPGWGRCVVDSTFHHFIDTNIRCVLDGPGAEAEDLRRYYLNLLLWLYLHDDDRCRKLRETFAVGADDSSTDLRDRLSATWREVLDPHPASA